MTSFTHSTIKVPPESHSVPRGRPGFHSHKTSDRLDDCERRTTSNRRTQPRTSIFKEIGLDDLSTSHHELAKPPAIGNASESKKVDDSKKERPTTGVADGTQKAERAQWFAKLGHRRPILKTASSAPVTYSKMSKIALVALLIAVVVPGFRNSGGDKINIVGADAGVIREAELVDNGSTIKGRQTSPTAICTRWSHMTANVNGTLYIYGGEATTESGQSSNTWNNDFLTLDLTKTWNIASPSLSGLPQPSGPPPVAEGYLWHTYQSLLLYGGEFSDDPSTSPLPVSTWEYNIASSTWTEYSNPQTSAGNNSDTAPASVNRAAEGAGLSVPELGRSWYFGGHLDLYTTPGWSDQIARLYLKSLLEFTHPGYANTGVSSLGSMNPAQAEGVYRNITEGGLQADAGFTERADGVLVYVPGWGEDGILLGLAGGTNDTFTEMNIIDVYDIAGSTWYKQSTSGTSPSIRVDPCAVVAAAPDGSSFNVYLYGGQNLVPYGSQIQYSDMWILTIPSFTWIQVDLSSQSNPPARAGHTCNIWDGQMVVVGGYVGKDISCDSPGIYVFNASSLQWISSFTALSSSSSSSLDSEILSGSIGYTVPDAVQSVIGGSSLGGATATSPVTSATGGPLATGHPPTFTVTRSLDGTTVIQTAFPTSTTSSSPSSTFSTSSEKSHSPNVGAITVGVIAALLAFLAAYLAFCSWLYRKQLKLYRDHVAMAQRASFNSSPGAGDGNQGNNEKILGPFGTELSNTTSGSGNTHTPESGGSDVNVIIPAPTASHSSSIIGREGRGSGYGYGSGSIPFPWRLSEEDENEEEGEGSYLAPPGGMGWMRSEGGSTAHSSVEDLLRGQEPSFFSVVLNPRRTLRVVNLD